MIARCNKKHLPIFLILAALGICGCGQSELPAPRLYPVRGTLTIRGEPGRYVEITLEPYPPDGRAEATARTSHDGTFELRTMSNDGVPDGAIPGEYEVVLVTGGAPADAPEGAVPTQFTGEFRTGIIVVIEEKDNDLAIDVP